MAAICNLTLIHTSDDENFARLVQSLARIGCHRALIAGHCNYRYVLQIMEKIIKDRQHSRSCITMAGSLLNFFGLECFSKFMQLNVKTLRLSFFLRFFLRSSQNHFTTITSYFYIFNFQLSDQTILLRHNSRKQCIRSTAQQTILSESRSDQQIRIPLQTIRPVHQIRRPLDQTATVTSNHKIR